MSDPTDDFARGYHSASPGEQWLWREMQKLAERVEAQLEALGAPSAEEALRLRKERLTQLRLKKANDIAFFKSTLRELGVEARIYNALARAGFDGQKPLDEAEVKIAKNIGSKAIEALRSRGLLADGDR